MTHVIILGGGPAGTLAAAAVASSADKMTVFERDALPSGPAARPGVPGTPQPHALVGRSAAVDSLMPGTIEQLLAAGARRLHMTADAVWLAGSGWLRRTPGRHYVIASSRDLLDWVLREQALLNAPGISLHTGAQAIGLVGSPQRVTGVRVRDQVTGGTEIFCADLIIDATGRASQAGHWLIELGLPVIPETVVNWRAGYASRRIHAPRDTDGTFPLVFIPPDFLATGPKRAATLLPIEEGQWQVTLLGTHGGEPDARQQRQEEFAAFARSARHPLVADLIAHAEPLGPVHLVRHMRWRRRHCTGLARRWPDGFAVLGDAAAAEPGPDRRAHPRSGCTRPHGRRAGEADGKSAALPRLSVADGRIYTVTVSDPTDPIGLNTLAAYHYAVLNSATAPLFALVS